VSRCHEVVDAATNERRREDDEHDGQGRTFIFAAATRLKIQSARGSAAVP
jgi:hypothetical protein